MKTGDEPPLNSYGGGGVNSISQNPEWGEGGLSVNSALLIWTLEDRVKEILEEVTDVI